MSAVLEFAAHPPIWVAYVAFPVAVVLAAVAGWFAKPTRTKVKLPAQNVGLDILEPEEQVGDDTFRMLGERLDRIQVTLSATAPVVPSATDDWADLTEGIVHGPEILRRIRDGLREQVIDHVAAEVAEDIEGEWRNLATRPATEWPGGAS